MRWALLFASSIALLSACGGASPPPPPATGNDPGYPVGPYGYGPSEVLPDLLFDGTIVASGRSTRSSRAD